MDYTIADRLAELRRAHGYSQESLAAQLGLSRQAVSRWERGESLPDTENLIALADLYGVSLDELVRPQEQTEEPFAEDLAGEECMGAGAPEAQPQRDSSPLVPLMPLEVKEHRPAEAEVNGHRPVEVAVKDHRPAEPAVSPEVFALEVVEAYDEPIVLQPGEHDILPDEASTEPSQALEPPQALESSQELEPSRRSHRAGWTIALVVAGCLLAAMLLASVTLGIASYLSFEPSSNITTSSSATSNTMLFDPEEVHDLRITWELGSVDIKMVDSDKTNGAVMVEEEYLDSGLEDYPMTASSRNGELSIGYGVGESEGFGYQGKRLTVLIPRSVGTMGDIHCTTGNGKFNVRDVTCGELHLQVTSGDVEAKGITADELDLQVSSGDGKVEGAISQNLAITLASGSAQVSTKTLPRYTTAEVGSGDLKLRLPRDSSFVAHALVASGDFDLDFAARKEGTTYVVGNGGETSVDVSVGSGEVRIAKR